MECKDLRFNLLSSNMINLIFEFNTKNELEIFKEIKNKKIFKNANSSIEKISNLTINSLFFVKTLACTTDGYALSLFYKKFNDKNLIIGGYSDNTVKVWDIDDNNITKSYPGHSDWVNSVCDISQDSSELVIASGSYDNSVKFWKNEECINTLLISHSVYYLLKAKFSISNDEFLAIATFQMVIFYNLTHKREEKRTLIIHDNYIYCVVNLSEYKVNYYATSSYDKNVNIIDFTNNEVIDVLKEHTGSVWFMVYLFEDNKDLLVTGSWDKTIKIWNLRSSKKSLFTISNHTNSVWALAKINLPHFNTNYFLSGGTDGKTLLCNAVEGVVIKEYNLHNGSSVYYYDFFEDLGEFYFISGSVDKRINIYKIIT